MLILVCHLLRHVRLDLANVDELLNLFLLVAYHVFEASYPLIVLQFVLLDLGFEPLKLLFQDGHLIFFLLTLDLDVHQVLIQFLNFSILALYKC